MQLVFPDDEAVQPHLKLLAMAKRWKKGQDGTSSTSNESTNNNDASTTETDNVPPPSSTTTTTTTTTEEDYTPLPAAHVDDEEMNDES